MNSVTMTIINPGRNIGPDQDRTSDPMKSSLACYTHCRDMRKCQFLHDNCKKAQKIPTCFPRTQPSYKAAYDEQSCQMVQHIQLYLHEKQELTRKLIHQV